MWYFTTSIEKLCLKICEEFLRVTAYTGVVLLYDLPTKGQNGVTKNSRDKGSRLLPTHTAAPFSCLFTLHKIRKLHAESGKSLAKHWFTDGFANAKTPGTHSRHFWFMKPKKADPRKICVWHFRSQPVPCGDTSRQSVSTRIQKNAHLVPWRQQSAKGTRVARLALLHLDPRLNWHALNCQPHLTRSGAERQRRVVWFSRKHWYKRQADQTKIWVAYITLRQNEHQNFGIPSIIYERRDGKVNWLKDKSNKAPFFWLIWCMFNQVLKRSTHGRRALCKAPLSDKPARGSIPNEQADEKCSISVCCFQFPRTSLEHLGFAFQLFVVVFFNQSLLVLSLFVPHRRELEIIFHYCLFPKQPWVQEFGSYINHWLDHLDGVGAPFGIPLMPGANFSKLCEGFASVCKFAESLDYTQKTFADLWASANPLQALLCVSNDRSCVEHSNYQLREAQWGRGMIVLTTEVLSLQFPCPNDRDKHFTCRKILPYNRNSKFRLSATSKTKQSIPAQRSTEVNFKISLLLLKPHTLW